jgi:hypothetical protein
MENRQKAVDNFQNDPACNLFVGNIRAAGVGLTLTASAHVIFAELDWVPGNMMQCEDRCHRIGQHDSVLIQLLALEGSLDAVMANTLIEKQEIIEQALDNPNTVFALPEKIEHAAATKLESFEKIEKQAELLPVESLQYIQQGIQLLASYCDGANALDGMGFNKMDSGIGKSLASFEKLSAKQAVLARKLCIKYQRQLSKELVDKIKI